MVAGALLSCCASASRACEYSRDHLGLLFEQRYVSLIFTLGVTLKTHFQSLLVSMIYVAYTPSSRVPKFWGLRFDPTIDKQLTQLINSSDLDIYGVLVIIAVATLAMPLTLRFSNTYFNTPGRNLVFLCALLNLAGPCLPLVVHCAIS